jgi:hypothetical protein
MVAGRGVVQQRYAPDASKRDVLGNLCSKLAKAHKQYTPGAEPESW